MKKRGRPSIYTPELAERICARLAKGQSLKSICKDDDMPCDTVVRQWALDDREGFYSHYTRSRDIGLDVMAEEVIEIADSSPERTATGIDGASVGDKRLRFDARRWYLSKLAPKRYGDSTTIKGDKDNPLVPSDVTQRVLKMLTIEQLEQLKDDAKSNES